MNDYNEDQIGALAQHSCPDCGLDMREGKTFFECPNSGCGYFITKDRLAQVVARVRRESRGR